MQNSRFIFTFILMLVIQLVLTKYCQFEPFLYICLLPAMALCFPTSSPTWRTMIAAFVTGLLVDGLADGPLGLNALALVGVTALQKLILRICIRDDMVERGYGFSYHENGFFKIFTALLVTTALFFAIYVIADSLGVRSNGFNFMKWACSTAVSLIFGLFAVDVLSPYKRNRQ